MLIFLNTCYVTPEPQWEFLPFPSIISASLGQSQTTKGSFPLLYCKKIKNCVEWYYLWLKT